MPTRTESSFLFEQSRMVRKRAAGKSRASGVREISGARSFFKSRPIN